MAGGAPTLYEERYCAMLEEHCKKGFSVESFASVVGVTKDTLYEWQKVHTEFSDSAGRALAHLRLRWEERLNELGDGITTKEVTVATDANGNEVVTTVERGKVNAGSVQFALSNFFRKEWNNRSEVEHTGEMPVKVVAVEGFTGFDNDSTD